MSDPERSRQRLRAERSRVLDQMHALDANFTEIVDATRDSNADDEHDPEGSTIAVERELVSSLAAGSRRHLDQIDSALHRIDAGTYGVCDTCGEPISELRLEARPAATRCITCV